MQCFTHFLTAKINPAIDSAKRTGVANRTKRSGNSSNVYAAIVVETITEPSLIARPRETAAISPANLTISQTSAVRSSSSVTDRTRQQTVTHGALNRTQLPKQVNFLYGDSSEEENAFRLHSYQATNESSDTGSGEDVVEEMSQQQPHQQRNSNCDQFQTVKKGDETCDGYGTTLSISNRPGAANNHEKEEKEAVKEIEANNIHQFFESLSH